MPEIADLALSPCVCLVQRREVEPGVKARAGMPFAYCQLLTCAGLATQWNRKENQS